MQEYKKPLLIGASVVALAFFGLYIKNCIQQSKFKPIQREQFIKIYRKIRKQNYSVYKQVAMVANQIANQFKQITPDMIKGYLEGPQSPIKVNDMFQKNIKKVCQANNLTIQHFELNLNHYKEDQQIKTLVQLSQRQFQTCLTGKVPMVPVRIPQSLTKQRILQIQAKLIKQKYLYQIGVFRKLRKYTQQQLASNPELMKQLPSPQSQQQLLEEQNLSQNDEPASAVLHAAILKFRSDQQFRQSLSSIQNSFRNIYNRYQAKINNNKITQAQLTQLQDQIIYFQYV